MPERQGSAEAGRPEPGPAAQGRPVPCGPSPAIPPAQQLGENNRQAPQYGASTALRHGDWKLIYRHGNQSFELYNLKKDIGEKENLAAREPRKLKEMAGLMGKLLRERKAQMPTYKKGNELGAPEGSSVPWPDQVKKGGN